ncbi:hypothetical protein AVEN_86602-1 [Araneus ventricosus]|uniref:Uncharacterized protein n=1 Tax=Araneus ventricosus TaxID=182803 RepID=A0A4Y2J5Y9_ARAVE|nr:hypothetical protein AVEN_86602-1 [Araneus ventricosus]
MLMDGTYSIRAIRIHISDGALQCGYRTIHSNSGFCYAHLRSPDLNMIEHTWDALMTLTMEQRNPRVRNIPKFGNILQFIHYPLRTSLPKLA